MRISDWSSDVCSSDLCEGERRARHARGLHRRRTDQSLCFRTTGKAPPDPVRPMGRRIRRAGVGPAVGVPASARERRIAYGMASRLIGALHFQTVCAELVEAPFFRSEEHTSELQSLMRISYAVFC